MIYKRIGHWHIDVTINAVRRGRCERRALGYDRIAAQMNAEGIETRTRGRWHGIMVNRILKAQEGQG
jgi:hypothetical protein